MYQRPILLDKLRHISGESTMIIGRQKKQELLERAFTTTKNRLITIYGRRRVGKTYLINEFFKSKDCIFFHVAGLQDGPKQDQIKNFMAEVSSVFLGGAPLITPHSWMEAFKVLSDQIKKPIKKLFCFLMSFNGWQLKNLIFFQQLIIFGTKNGLDSSISFSLLVDHLNHGS